LVVVGGKALGFAACSAFSRLPQPKAPYAFLSRIDLNYHLGGRVRLGFQNCCLIPGAAVWQYLSQGNTSPEWVRKEILLAN
jgi:hypothetical protein